jgi:GntR family transcriptional regulator
MLHYYVARCAAKEEPPMSDVTPIRRRPEFDPASKPLEYAYVQLADHIEELIKEGEFEINKPLPGERELVHRFELSLGTIRRSMEVLRERGLVTTVQCKGTFVVSTQRKQVEQPSSQPL